MGLVAASRITAIWHLYIFFGVAIAIGINTLAYSPHMSLIPKWFVQKRGLATGLVLSSLGMSMLIIVPLVEWLIHMVGWRSSFLFFAGAMLFLVFPMTAVFQRRSPEELGQFPDGQSLEAGRDFSQKGEEPTQGARPSFRDGTRTLKAALGSKAFWHMVLAAFTNGFLINMLLVHQVIYTVDVGYSVMMAATMFGIVGLMGSMGGVFYGHLSDRMGREMAYTLGSGAAFAGLLFFMFVKDTSVPWMLYAFVILYGAGNGSMATLVASSTGDIFPGSALGRILSSQAMAFGIGGALGPYLGGYYFDRTGNYTISFVLCLVSICLGVLGIWMAAPRRGMHSSLVEKESAYALRKRT
jgi:MFS family permease